MSRNTPTNVVGGVYNATPPVFADHAFVAFQFDSSGNLLTTGGGSGSNASVNPVGTPVPGSATMIGWDDGSGNTQFVSAANPLPISGTISATNPSVGLTGSTAPTSATEMGVIDGSGNLRGVSASFPMRVDPTGTTTQPVSFGALPAGSNLIGEVGTIDALTVPTTATWTSSTTTNTAITLNTSNYASVLFTFVQTNSMLSFQMIGEGYDGANWFSINAVSDQTGSNVTTITLGGTSTSHTYLYNVVGYQQFRIRVTQTTVGAGQVIATIAAHNCAIANFVNVSNAVSVTGTVTANQGGSWTVALGGGVATIGAVKLTDGSSLMGLMANFGTSPGAVDALNANVSLFQGTTLVSSSNPLFVENVSDMTGTTPGTAPSFTTIIGGIYNSSAPSPTTGQTLPLQLDASGNLNVNIKAGAGSGGTAITDEGTFTEASTSFTPIGGYFKTSPAALTTGQGGAVSMTAARAMFVDIHSIAGAATGATNPLFVEVTDGTNGLFLTAHPGIVAGAGTAGSAAGGVLTIQGVASMTKLLVTPDALPANQSVNMSQINAHTTLEGGTNGSLAIGGTVATNVAITANPVNLGAQAVSSENTAVTTARQVQLVADLVGKLIVLPYANPENFVSGVITSAMTGTTSTLLLAAPAAGLRNYITQITVSNSHATVGTDIIIQDGSGGTTLYVIPAAAAYGGATITFPVPLRQPTTATGIYCANVTTGSNTKVSASGYKGA